ncbi:hypothetical protein LTR95_008348 [Oleoguttula sp. CCFEE 5521]
MAATSQPVSVPQARPAASPYPPLPKSLQNLKQIGPFPKTLSPVDPNGSFAFDRLIKTGPLLKRTRKTKTWKPVFVVVRPGLISVYRGPEDRNLRHQIKLKEITAVARQRDPKREERCVFGVFSPSRNFRFEAGSEKEAEEWVDVIRREARIGEEEEEMMVQSPTGGPKSWQGFGRITADDASGAGGGAGHGGGYSSSDAEVLASPPYARKRERATTAASATSAARRASHVSYNYSGAEHSYSDFSDSGLTAAARLSSLNLAAPDAFPSSAARPALTQRTPSQLSVSAIPPSSPAKTSEPTTQPQPQPQSSTNVTLHFTPILLLSRHSKLRRWKRVHLTIRPVHLALYKDASEYEPLLLIPWSTIIDVVEIDPVSKSKQFCLQVIGEDRSWRFCALDVDGREKVLSVCKGLGKGKGGG